MKYDDNYEDFNTPFYPFGEKETPRALNTLFRNQYRMVARYLALIDNKANIMIRLNSFIISGVVFLFTIVDNFTGAEIAILFIFIITSIVSLANATLAARPVKIGKRNSAFNINNIEENLFNVQIDNLSQETYEKAFDKMMRNQKSIFKTMINDLFVGRLILEMKFKRLRYSYNVFLAGIGLIGILIMLLVLYQNFF